MKRSLKVRIEGDFIHSFLYSGTLFLVGADSVVRTYNWESLVTDAAGRHLENSLCAFEVSQFLVDFRRFRESIRNVAQSFEMVISAQDLQRSFVGELKLAGWPADIYVYANRFYTADERGVLQTPFSFEKKRLDNLGQVKLTEDRAYSISPNDSNRVAIAAGSNGVFAAAPPASGRMKSGDIYQVLDVESYDCEWVNHILLVNAESGPHAAIFQQMPHIPENPSSDFWQAYGAARRSGPKLREKLGGDGHKVMYAWLGGKKLFTVTSDGGLVISQLSDPGVDAPIIEKLNANPVYKTVASEMLADLFSIRSASFGSVAEAGNRLLVLSESGIEQVTTEPVSWRVFPRAKSYVNHLHVVLDDAVHISAYLPSETEGETDLLGVEDQDTNNSMPVL